MSTANEPGKLAILDVGHGNSAVLQDEDGVVVIDCGPGAALLEYLEQEKIQRVAVVLISHADQDHIGGLVALLAARTVEVECVRLNTDSLKGSKVWDDLLYELDRLDRRGEIDFGPALVRDKEGTYDQGTVAIEILGPSKYLAGRGPGSLDRAGRRIRTNSVSAVVRLVRNGKPLGLFTGDLDEVGLDDLVRARESMTAPVLVFPHHGGRASTADLPGLARRLCRLVEPRVVIFSIGRGLHGTPRPEVVEAVRKELPGVRIVCTQLSEHCAGDLPKTDPEHLNNEFARGREGRRCCAGTVVVHFEEPGALLPVLDQHRAFIDAVAPSALCR